MIYNKLKFPLILLIGALLFTTIGCEVDEIENPNSPSIESLEDGATLGDLRLLAIGLESVLRFDMQFYYWTTSMVGREYYDLNGTDPRYTGELLGAGGADLDNNGFLTTRSFSANYKAIRVAQILINATNNSTDANVTTAVANGYIGFAQITQAYKLLLTLNRQFDNGCRIDVVDPDNLGPFVSYDDGLTEVARLLDDASTILAGAEVTFPLSSGFGDFGATGEGLAQLAQALLARVELYRGNNDAAIGALNKSFFSLTEDLDAGVYHVFGLGGNDVANPLFNVVGEDLYVAQSSFITDAEDGDTRIAAKTTQLDEPAALDGLSGDYQVTIYESNTAPVGIIRNEELVLIYAEANIGTNNAEAVAAINVVRNAAGLSDYSGATDDASLTDEVLNQRRYSLFGEGHRWIDLRRYNRLNELPLDRAGDKVHVEFPRPVTEEG